MNNNTIGFSGRQQLLGKFYPWLMKMGKWLGIKSKEITNTELIVPTISVFHYSVYLNSGKQLQLSSLKGKKILLVNTASDCGYTAQYAELQKLYQEYSSTLAIIGFPANDFKNQESGTDTAIEQFCTINFGVRFPLSVKTQVVPGEKQHPVYEWLCNPAKNGWNSQEPEWNFAKYLLNEEGVLTHYFAPGISPLDYKVKKALHSSGF